jgi:pycsar effector protein
MKIKGQRPQLDYLLSETRRQLIDLSNMADTKANILLSVSSVLITISLTRVSDPAWRLAVLVLAIFMSITITLALLTVSPSIDVSPRPKLSPQDREFNPLFFANYAHMSYEEYSRHMEKVLNDPNAAYEVQVHEIYHVGVYLQRTKYNYVKYGYMFFFVGTISSLIIYLMQNLW